MTARHGGALWRRGIALAAAVCVLTLLAAPGASAADDRLPDLKVAQIRDLRIERTSSGRRLLRFTSLMWNKGAGPFEVRATRSSTGSPWDLDQIVYDDEGGARRVETDASLRYAGDGHDHWHVRQMMSYHLWSVRGTSRDQKIGFCFFDTNLIDGALPRSPSSPVYRQSTCGTRGSLNTRSGISVGWGDKYPWNFAFQWIDVSNLPGGTYTLRAVVDLYDHFEEGSNTNNCDWVRIKFGSSGSTVTVLERGKDCIDDYSTTRYALDVAWALETGISKGCDADLFCTYDPVSRGQMATFLAKAMDLPPTTTDFFDDDDGTTHEPNINRIAEAGITQGCGTRRYCPSSTVRRGSMAALLAHALDLPSTDQDFFTDDDDSPHEWAINRIAAAGITSGCAEDRFCPDNKVSRGQMAALLHRSFGGS